MKSLLTYLKTWSNKVPRPLILLISLGNQFKQTLKTLLALASGRPIVNPSWVDACRQSGSLLRIVHSHIATDNQKERELRFSMWGTYNRVLQQGRVLEAPAVMSTSTRTESKTTLMVKPLLDEAHHQGSTAKCTVPRHCVLSPGLRKSEKDPLTLPLIIEAAGGMVMELGTSLDDATATLSEATTSPPSSCPQGKKAAAAAAAAARKMQIESCLVFGVPDDKLWAKRTLPPGKAVFDRTVLINGITRGQLDLSSPLFVVK